MGRTQNSLQEAGGRGSTAHLAGGLPWAGGWAAAPVVTRVSLRLAIPWGRFLSAGEGRC